MTHSASYDESDDAPQDLGLAGTMCRDCRHWLPVECLHHGDVDDRLGRGSADLLEREFGLCDWDAPAIVLGDNREYDRTEEECWEAR